MTTSAERNRQWRARQRAAGIKAKSRANGGRRWTGIRAALAALEKAWRR